MDEARPDLPVRRFNPDPTVVARAQRALMAEEDVSPPSRRYIRQRWEEAFGATRVAMDALREVWPLELDHLEEPVAEALADALRGVEHVYEQLVTISEQVTSQAMHYVMSGTVRTHDDLDHLEVPE